MTTILLFLIFLLVSPFNAFGVPLTRVPTHPDPAGGGVGLGAFGHIRYISSRNAILSIFGGSGGADGDNSVRLTELRKKSGGLYGPNWVYVWCNEADPAYDPVTHCNGTAKGRLSGSITPGGVQMRDNYASFYVPPPVDEYWILSGSHLPETWPGPGSPFRSGRLSFSSCGPAPAYSQGCATWVSKSTTNEGATDGSNGVSAVIKWTGLGYIHGSAPGSAWNDSLDMGLMFGGGGEGDPSTSSGVSVIVRNVSGNLCGSVQGTARYIECRLGAVPKTPPANQWIFCGTTNQSTDPANGGTSNGYTPFLHVQAQNALVAGDGGNFYLFGTASSSLNSIYSCVRSLWKYHVETKGGVTTGTWTELAPPPMTGFAPAIAYDSNRNKIYAQVYNHIYAYDIATDTWSGDIAPANTRNSWDGFSVYVPTADVVIFSGGYSQENGGQDYTFTSLDPGSNSLYIPPRTWVAVPFTGGGGVSNNYAPCYHNTCKHTRATINPTDGKIYWLGGDWPYFGVAGGPDDSNRAPVYTLDLTNIKDASSSDDTAHAGTWTQEYSYCKTQGEVMPGGPDEVGWSWDSDNNKFWAGWGYYQTSQGGGMGCGSQTDWVASNGPLTISAGYSSGIYIVCSNTCQLGTDVHYSSPTNYTTSWDAGKNTITLTNVNIPAGQSVHIWYQQPGAALQQQSLMSYNPVTKTFTNPSSNPPWAAGGYLSPHFSVYDPTSHALWMSGTDGSGNHLTAYWPATNTYGQYHFNCSYPGTSAWTAVNGVQSNCPAGQVYTSTGFSLQWEYIAMSGEIATPSPHRKIYGIDPEFYRLIEIDTGTGIATFKADPPIPAGQENFIRAIREKWSQNMTWEDLTHIVFDEANNKLYMTLCFPPVGVTDNTCHLDGGQGTNSVYLFIYDPTLDDGVQNPWTTDPGYQPDGKKLRANAMVFDSTRNVLMLYGGQSSSEPDPTLTHYFLYRYGPSVATQVTADTTNPQILITSPACAATSCNTTSPTFDVSGTASDNVALATPAVTWVNNRSGSGNATGSGSWSVTGIPLQSGDNLLTFTAHDTSGNTAAISFHVFYSTAPGVAYQGAGKQTQSGNLRAN